MRFVEPEVASSRCTCHPIRLDADLFVQFEEQSKSDRGGTMKSMCSAGAPLALVLLLTFACSTDEGPNNGALGPGDTLSDIQEVHDGGALSDDGDVAELGCEPGFWRYSPDGGCLPADPCRNEVACADARRICLNEVGTSVCGRCLDGWESVGDEACTESARDVYEGRFRVGSDFFWVWSGARYERVYVTGVNLAGAVPGTGPNGRQITHEQYASWLSLMSGGGLNVVRVYSQHPPALYEALVEHNLENPETPIYLLQGVWLREPEETVDLVSLSDLFDTSIETTLASMHGEREDYTTDVSQWVLGWLIGREVHAPEVIRTDATYPELTSYEGTTMRLASGSATEVWIAERFDRLVAFEQEHWGESRPVAFSSWMELDPLSHPTEPSSTEKDIAQIDLSGIDPFGAPAGHFISYHVYPYYPKFVSEDPGYRAHVDEDGPNGYRGLLLRLRDHYRDLPVLVAEYGIPSSWGRGHPSYSGMHHGGHTEREQGWALARMTGDIHDTRYAGGLVFQWQDGWWKPTWITNRVTFPRHRYGIWHDLTTPSQSYGLLAFEPPAFVWESVLEDGETSGPVTGVQMAADARALHVKVTFDEPVGSPRLTIGIDTYRDDLGDTQLPDGTETSVRSELAIELDESSAQLYVIEEYDLYAAVEGPVDRYRSVARDGGAWVPVRWQMTGDHASADGAWFFEGEDYEIGALRVRGPVDTATSMDAVVICERSIELTLPWVLLQYADPSTRTVVHNDPSTDEIDGEVSDGIRLVFEFDDVLAETRRFTWPTWDEAPLTTERLKASAASYFEAIDAL